MTKTQYINDTEMKYSNMVCEIFLGIKNTIFSHAFSSYVFDPDNYYISFILTRDHGFNGDIKEFDTYIKNNNLYKYISYDVRKIIPDCYSITIHLKSNMDHQQIINLYTLFKMKGLL